MSDVDTRIIDDAVEEFRAGTMPTLKPAGLAPVRAIVRRRRQARTVAVAALAAVLGVLSVAAGLQIDRRHQGPPFTGPSRATATPRPTASSPAGHIPDLAVVPSAQPSGCTRIRDGRTDVCNATLDIPAWAEAPDCPSGRIGFTAGIPTATPMAGQLSMSTVGSVDVDHDGAPDTIAIVTCNLQVYQVHTQVLAFRGDGTLLGRVVATGGPITDILDVMVLANGSIGVEVSNDAGTHGWPYFVTTLQWRTYGWTGRGFTQTAGSTSFTANPSSADLSLSVGPIVFGTPRNGVRQASVSITVRNKGSRPAAKLSLFLFFAKATVSGTGVTQATFTTLGQVCSVGTLDAGATWRRTFTFTTQPDGVGPPGDPTFQPPDGGGIRLTIGDQIYTELHQFSVTYQ